MKQIAVCMLLLLAFPAPAHAADPNEERAAPADAEAPIGNDVFADDVTHARVTQRFEIYNPRSEQQLRTLREMGFTQVLLDWPNLHSQATDADLDVVLANWWSVKSKEAEVQRGVDLAQQVVAGRLAGVSMMDEPERYAPDTPFSFYQALYGGLRQHFDELLPGVPLEISHWGPLASWTQAFYDAFVPLYQATDRIRLMPYPDLYEGPLNEVYYQMLRSRRIMELAGRRLPQVVILQTWVLPDKPDLPTIEELRVMAYLAMLAGADTVSFYSYDPEVWGNTPGFEEGFASLMSELTRFSREYRDVELETRMTEDGILTTSVSWPHGETTLIRINTNRTAVSDMEPLEVRLDAPTKAEIAGPRCGPVSERRWRRRCFRRRR